MKESELTLILRATAYAIAAHGKQVRKGPSALPYICHPVDVALKLSQATSSQRGGDVCTAIVAAILHDVVEDTSRSFDDISREFGPTVARVVAEVTDDERLSKVARKRAQIESVRKLSWEAQVVRLADKLSNCQSLLLEVPTTWAAGRMRGYLVWSAAVTRQISPAHPVLHEQLEQVYATVLPDSDGAPAVPPDSRSPAALDALEAYLASLPAGETD